MTTHVRIRLLGALLVPSLLVLAIFTLNAGAQGPGAKPLGQASTAADATFGAAQTPDRSPAAERAAQAARRGDSKALDAAGDSSKGHMAPNAAGGPDAFGYTYEDSNEPGGPVYSFVEISATGTLVPLEDDSQHGPISIGFPFDFYGNDYTQVWMSSNGWLSIGGTNPGTAALSNECPMTGSTGVLNLVAGIWDDLDQNTTAPNGQGFHQSFAAGTCPYDGYSGACFVAEWSGMYHFGSSPADNLTFQTILFDNNDLLIQIKDAGNEAGSGSTTGILGLGGASSLTYACNSSTSITDSLAIHFDYPPPTPRFMNSFLSAPAIVQAGDELTYTVVITNSGDLSATNVLLIDPIPVGTTFDRVVSGGAVYNMDANQIEFTGTLDINEQAEISFVVDTFITSTCGTTILNTATISHTTLIEPLVVSATTELTDQIFFLTDFENDEGGFVTSTQGGTGPSDWEWGIPTVPVGLGAASGTNVWATNLDGNYTDRNGFSVLTRTLDLTAIPQGIPLTLSWEEFFRANSDFDFGEVLINDELVYDIHNQGFVETEDYRSVQVDISDYIGQEVTLTFRFFATGVSNELGWYIDDVRITACIEPGLAIEKTVGLDPDACAVTNQLGVLANQEVYYCLTVQNTGAITLPIHTADDSILGNLLTDYAYDLAPGASLVITNALLAPLGPVAITADTINVITWTANYTDANIPSVITATSSATVTIGIPDLQVTKSVTPTLTSTGNAATYSITIANEGQAGLVDVLITDTLPTGGTYSNAEADVESLPSGAPPQVMSLDDGTIDSSVGVGSTANNTTANYLSFNRFTPSSPTGFWLEQIRIFWPDSEDAGGSLIGRSINLYVWEDNDSNPANGATLLATIPATISVEGSYQLYTLPTPVVLNGTSDFLVGFDTVFASTTPSPRVFPSAVDSGASQGRSWIAFNQAAPPTPGNLGGHSTISTLDALGLPANLMIRALLTPLADCSTIPTGALTNIPAAGGDWVISDDTIYGGGIDFSAGCALNITYDFSATSVGSYTNVVTATTLGLDLPGTADSDSATLTVEQATPTATATATATGTSTPTATPSPTATATATATSSPTATSEADPEIVVPEEPISVTLAVGDSFTRSVPISNTGGASLTFTITEEISGGGDIPWAEVAPTSGAIPISGSINLDVGFHAIVAPGVHVGTLLVDSNDPNTPQAEIALMLDIAPLTCYDYNESGLVDIGDIQALTAAFNDASAYDPRYDLIPTFGQVDILDIITIAEAWDQPCS